MDAPEEEDREKGTERILEEIKPQNLLNLTEKKTNLYFQID